MNPLFIIIPLAILLIVLLVASVNIVPQAHAYVIERLGTYHTTWSPGLHMKVPFIDKVAKKITMMEQVADFPPQAVITMDKELFCVLPAISRIAERLSVALPDTKVYFIGNCDIKREITDAMRDACAYYGHTYIALSGIDKVNGHPTALGMAQIKDQVLNAMTK